MLHIWFEIHDLEGWWLTELYASLIFLCMCSDGVTQSGLYVAICCIWESLRDEQEVDIFQTVKHLRYYRQQIVQDFVSWDSDDTTVL